MGVLRMKMVLGLVLPFFLVSCSQDRESKLLESPDRWNAPRSLGLEDKYYWDNIKTVTSAHMSPGWQGSGLASQSFALANRWNYLLDGVDSSFRQFRSLEDQLSSLWSLFSYESQDNEQENEQLHSQMLLALSTAEKVDYLNGAVTEPSVAMLDRMSQLETVYETQVKPEANRISELEATVRSDYDHAMREFDLQIKELNKLNEELRLAEELQQTERIELLKVRIKEVNSQIEVITASFMRFSESFIDLDQQRIKAFRPYNVESRKTLGLFTATMPVTGEAWDDYLRLSTTYSGNWSWFGHCHGAAAAGLYEPRTKNAVLAKKGSREILLFEQDVRNLFVKAWADQAPLEEFFVGRRCYHSDVEAGPSGRPIDGTICSDLNQRSCSLSKGGREIFIVDDRLMANGSIDFRLSTSGAKLTGRVVTLLTRDNYRIRASLAEGAPPTEIILSVRKSCRDVNAMTFHLALTEFVAKGRGIIIDGSSRQSVWNAAVNGFDIEFQSIQLKDGTYSTPGELIPVSSVDDQYGEFRASGTAYLIPVVAKTFFHEDKWDGLRSRERLPSFDQPLLIYQYSLEFDSERKLIGGEWGGLVASSNSVYQGTPDFIWRLNDKEQLKPGLINVDMLSKIRSCAQASDATEMPIQQRTWNDETGNLESSTQLIPVKKCEL